MERIRVLITGAAGFIGSALARRLVRSGRYDILCLDALTYAGNLAALAEIADSPAYRFVKADICDSERMRSEINGFRPQIITHLAAETHVDRSIDGPAAFIRSNLMGTFVVLEEALAYWKELQGEARAAFRFHHISTDEVCGSLGAEGRFTEQTPYDPRSPYSASKAGSDHLVRAWYHTYGLPTLLTNCSNNYGPHQVPEKLIPLMIAKALRREVMPVYGTGQNIRDWIYVDDHAAALQAVFERGTPGDSFMIGGDSERTNLEVVQAITRELDRIVPRDDGHSYAEQIQFVQDRPGHDFRYAIDSAKIRRELGWQPAQTFASGLAHTVRWYVKAFRAAPLADTNVVLDQRIGLGNRR